MKKKYLFLILFLTFNLGFCQEATLRVLGNSKYSEIAENKVLLLNFEYNSEICNPITQNKTIEIQVNELNQNLITEKIEFKLLPKETLNSNPEKSKSFELLLSLDSNDYKIQKMLQRHYFHLPHRQSLSLVIHFLFFLLIVILFLWK